MPVLEITDGQGWLDPNAAFTIQAVMAYPESAERREELLATYVVGAALKRPDYKTFEPFLSEFVPVLYRSSTPAKVLSQARGRLANAWISSRVLLQLLAAHQNHPDIGATPTMVIEVLGRWIADGRIKFSGNAGGRSRRSLWAAWQDFKPAAHLWAARVSARTLSINPLEGESNEDKRLPTLTMNLMRSFLAHAEAIRQAAIAARFLSPDDTWSPPPDLKLETVTIKLEPLPDDLVSAFRAYVPEHSREDPLE